MTTKAEWLTDPLHIRRLHELSCATMRSMTQDRIVPCDCQVTYRYDRDFQGHRYPHLRAIARFER